MAVFALLRFAVGCWNAFLNKAVMFYIISARISLWVFAKVLLLAVYFIHNRVVRFPKCCVLRIRVTQNEELVQKRG